MELHLTTLARPRRVARSPEPETPSKACRTCKRSKPMTAFAPHHSAKDGHRHDCRTCVTKGKKRDPKKVARRTRRSRARRKADPSIQAANRIAVKNWTRRNPHAPRARAILHRALKRGEITKPPRCQVKGCAKHKIEGHHPDYRAPLEVLWACRPHHKRIHAGEAVPLKAGVDRRLARVPVELRA